MILVLMLDERNVHQCYYYFNHDETAALSLHQGCATSRDESHADEAHADEENQIAACCCSLGDYLLPYLGAP